jgi:hypothetical protein
MKGPSLGFVLALAGAIVLLAARCTDVTVNRSPDGTISGVASGPDVPPVEIDNDGIHEITPLPGPYEPVYPVTPPAPTATPRPG